MTPRALLLALIPAFLGAVAAPVLAHEVDGSARPEPVEGRAGPEDTEEAADAEDTVDSATPSVAPAPAADPSAPSSPPALVFGLELRAVAAQHTDVAARRTILPFGPGIFVRSGLLHVGLSSEFQPPPSSPDWYAPGTSSLRRTGRAVWFTFGPSIPGTMLGSGGVARHVRLELLGEAGVVATELVEDLGAGGIGDRSWKKTTPFLGGRLGTRFRFGGRWGGHFGFAGFYRQPLGDDKITAVTGARVSVVGSSFGLMLFGGPDVELR